MIIAISGKQQAGKDTVGDYLVENYGFAKLAFADKLKDVAMDLFELSYEECYGVKTERSRFILQKLGTEVARNIDPDVWVNYTMRIAKEYEDKGISVVITDARYPNEANVVRKLGGKVWRIERRYRNTATGDQEHASEIALDNYKNFNYTIYNDKSKEELYAHIRLILGD